MNVVRRSMLGALLLASAAHADRQVIAPGTGLQSAVEVDSGANGICETKARGDDLQAAKLGQGAPFADEIRSGPQRISSAKGAPCPSFAACRSSPRAFVSQAAKLGQGAPFAAEIRCGPDR